MNRIALLWVPLVVGACRTPSTIQALPGSPVCDDAGLSDAYERYVEPFVSGTVAQSCRDCHMTGIDLSLYAQDTPCATYACMVELGVADPSDPGSSTVLGQIRMGDPTSSVFDVAHEEAAMLEWLTWNATCHDAVCDPIEAGACGSGTGAASTGTSPIGDCSEGDVLAAFWDAVMIDRGRCLICHSDYGQAEGTFGSCTTTEDCEFEQICSDGTCYAPGPFLAPHFFEGGPGALAWTDDEARAIGLHSMYNVLATGMIDRATPLDSSLLTKPLLEGFQPTAVYGDGVSIDVVAAGVGVGTAHGGTSKFNFGCHSPPCLTEGVVDCRTDVRCSDVPCPGTRTCVDGFCREPDSVCDPTYVAYVGFAEYAAACSP